MRVFFIVPRVGIEPTRVIHPTDFKSVLSTSSNTSAKSQDQDNLEKKLHLGDFASTLVNRKSYIVGFSLEI